MARTVKGEIPFCFHLSSGIILRSLSLSSGRRAGTGRCVKSPTLHNDRSQAFACRRPWRRCFTEKNLCKCVKMTVAMHQHSAQAQHKTCKQKMRHDIFHSSSASHFYDSFFVNSILKAMFYSKALSDIKPNLLPRYILTHDGIF